MTGDREALVRAHRQGAVIHPPTRLEPDVLSGLPARSALQTRLSEPLPAGRGRGVAVLEIDALGMISEVYGPDTGSAVLRELARRLDAVTGEAHLGRWRPDVFVWVQDAADAEAVIGELSRAVVAHLREPFEADGHRLRLAARMGLAVTPRTPVADLLAAATSALRNAKRPDRDDVVWYSETMGLEHPGVTQLSAALGRGIANDELRLHYQPVMDLTEDRVAGVEALVRWERPGDGLLGPGSFIDVAERTGQIVALGAWVAHHACATAVHLNALDLPPLGVSINVSARQLADPGLIGMLAQVLRDTGCPPSVLTIEITETALMVDLEDAVVTLATIKDMGIGLDLDDFGTATRRCSTSSTSRSTGSRSTSPSSPGSAPTTRTPPSSRPPSPWPMPSGSAPSPRVSRHPPSSRCSSRWAVTSSRATCSAGRWKRTSSRTG